MNSTERWQRIRLLFYIILFSTVFVYVGEVVGAIGV